MCLCSVCVLCMLYATLSSPCTNIKWPFKTTHSPRTKIEIYREYNNKSSPSQRQPVKRQSFLSNAPLWNSIDVQIATLHRILRQFRYQNRTIDSTFCQKFWCRLTGVPKIFFKQFSIGNFTTSPKHFVTGESNDQCMWNEKSIHSWHSQNIVNTAAHNAYV